VGSCGRPERYGRSRAADGVGFAAGDVGAVEADLTGTRWQDAVEEIEEGGLAGAIGSDDAKDFAVMDIE
jgi:hypothetical protein